ncbi:ATP-binding protein [Thermosulfuriphilus sp.]
MKPYFKHLSLYHKLCLGYIILLFITFLPCAVSLYSLSRLEGLAVSLAQEDVELTTTIEYLKGLLPSIEAEGRRLVTLYKEDAYQTLITLANDFKDRLTIIKDKGPPRARTVCRRLEESLERLKDLAEEVKRELPKSPPASLSPQEIRREEEVKERVSQMSHFLAETERSIRLDIRTKAARISEKTSRDRKITFFTFLVALVFALLAPWFLYKYIKRPIDSLKKGTEAIGRGQFDHIIPVLAEDELGQLAQAFNKMTGRLKELDTLKSEFISVVSHELRTPLTSIKEAASLLLDLDVAPLNPKQKRLIEIIDEGISRLHGFIDDLLHLTRLEAKLIPVEKHPHNPLRLIREVRNTLLPAAKEKEISIEVIAPQDLEEALIDADRTFRALMNIIHNAIKFSPQGGKINIVVTSYYDKHRHRWLRIGVVDAGLGIPATEREKVFDKFYQVQALRHKDGCGLGLAIARELILAQGGRIWLESPPEEKVAIVSGKGTVFWLELPYS